MTRLNILGVPSSAGSYSAGQEQAPAALRDAGLLDALTAAGNEVHDAGDLTPRTWRPDRVRRYAQNLPEVVASLRELTAVVPTLLRGEERLLVLGGNCTIALGVCAGLRHLQVDPNLVYVDRHFDLNTPDSTTQGALDWMGIAHALALDGTASELVDALGPRPLLDPERLSFLGVDPDEATDWERQTGRPTPPPRRDAVAVGRLSQAGRRSRDRRPPRRATRSPRRRRRARLHRRPHR